MNKVEVLDKAIGLLESGWTQEGWARDANGESVAWNSERATCWCAEGALRRVLAGTDSQALYPPETWETFYELRDAVAFEWDERKGCDITTLNDDPETTQEDVIGVFKRTRERLASQVAA